MGDLISVLTDNLDEWLAGFWVTLRIVSIAFVIAMVVGTLVAALLCLFACYTAFGLLAPRGFRPAGAPGGLPVAAIAALALAHLAIPVRGAGAH